MDHRSPGPWKPSYLILICLVAFALGVLAERYDVLPTSRPQPYGLGRTFGEAWHHVQKDFVDREAVQPKRMTDGAILGMLNSLGDQGHTTYLTAEEFHQMKTSLEGHMEGIGAKMSMQHGRVPTVMATMRGSPAEQAGMRPGDVFLDVDGKDVTDLSLDRIVALVRGPAGTKVRLTLSRDGTKIDLEITRARVEVPSADWHMLPGEPKVAHLALSEFGVKAGQQVEAALREAAQAGARGLLVDLRGNSGGYKDQAVAVTSLFLKDGNVFLEKDARGDQTPVPVKKGDFVTDLPLCVLLDEGTASSAEIFAGALQDYHRGKLIGTRTFGTGTVLSPFELSDHSAVLLATSEWLTPDGRQIWRKGIEPDVHVALPQGAAILQPDGETNLTASALAKSEDQQLLTALDLLKKALH
jgi:carboxyl-terminal processing protease